MAHIVYSPTASDLIPHEHRTRLFAHQDAGLDDIEVLVRPTDLTNPTIRSQPLIQRRLHSPGGLTDFFLSEEFSLGDSFFILRQTCTLGRFNLSFETFRTLLDEIGAFHPFINTILGFGFRLRDDDNFSSCNIQPDSLLEGSVSFQMSYNVRYIDKNGRKDGSMWSLRHCGVYQKCISQSKTSIWILLQPSQSVYNRLIHMLRSESYLEDSYRCHGLPIHLAFLADIEREWREYITTLQERFLLKQEAALYSSVGVKVDVDFIVTFADYQELHRSMSKLRRDQVVLSSHLDILDRCSSLFQRLPISPTLNQAESLTTQRHATELAVGSIQAYLRNHKRCIEKLLKDSEGVSQVLIQILNHRNDEILIRTQANTQQMSEENSIGTRSVVMILENSQRDTKMVKVLTIVAMLYLPASLVASIFSSNLVQFGSQPNPQSHNEGVYVAKEFWLLPAVSLGLLVVTFGLTHGLLRAYPSAW